MKVDIHTESHVSKHRPEEIECNVLAMTKVIHKGPKLFKVIVGIRIEETRTYYFSISTCLTISDL